jgi:Ca2+-binding RTX toxin-like protein
MVGTAGNDVLHGFGGNDWICAGPGNDLIKGGTGNDELFGEPGRDKLIGGARSDSVQRRARHGQGCELPANRHALKRGQAQRRPVSADLHVATRGRPRGAAESRVAPHPGGTEPGQGDARRIGFDTPGAIP